MTDSEPASSRPRAVVGLGASAGGLHALETFLLNLPPATGIGFVVITHQHAGQASLLPELLARKTSMPVIEVRAPTPLEPDHIYTAPPGANLTIREGILELVELERFGFPIDHFFRSLARDAGDRAVGVVLSGTGTDGSLGLIEIKAQLGMAMAQNDDTAEYSGMPRSAVATKVVDFVLSPAEMPARLVAYVESLALARDRGDVDAATTYQRIFELLRRQVGHDFSHYKRSTVSRRVERRMNLHQVGSLDAYVEFLRAHPDELERLFSELLIGVTSFFRDAAAWEALAAVLADSIDGKPADYVFRAWVAGCSTGEEAYSVAMLLDEAMQRSGSRIGVQIFATDLDARAIDVARAGIFPAGIADSMEPERLSKYFVREDSSYRISKAIREMVVFAQQNLLSDPPFTKLDLLCCRNLLIYLDTTLQKRILPMFHYALKADGLLFLGSSESLGALAELFEPIDAASKLFRRNEVIANAFRVEFPAVPHAEITGAPRSPAGLKQIADRPIERMLLDELVPPTVVIHERGEVVHIQGRTGNVLEPAQGSAKATANVFNMARPGLDVSLLTAVRRAIAEGVEIVYRDVKVKSNGGVVAVDLRVKRLSQPEALEGLIRISFDRVWPVPDAELELSTEPDRASELESELRTARASHQGTLEEFETANEELKSANEELQSTNEELQSANEELETSKEEMQSLNEELQTVNAELQSKVDELSGANNDMKNLLNGTDIGTLFLDSELRVKRFTDQARRIIRLIPSDIGRPVSDLVSTLIEDNLVDDAREVLRTLVVKETEVRAQSGEIYLMKVLPYRTTENVIDGLVLTFVDISRLKTLQAEQARLLEFLERSSLGVFEQDLDNRFVWACGDTLGRSPDDVIGKQDDELLSVEDAVRFGALKAEALATRAQCHASFGFAHDNGQRRFLVFVEPRRQGGAITGIGGVAIELADGVDV